MRRPSEASLFFRGFPRKKNPLHNGSYENSFTKAIWWWMLLYRTLRKATCTNMTKNMSVVTPRCAAAAAVVSAVVLRRPTKEYTHPYSMMHRRLPAAGIEVAPHYHQMLVTIAQENHTRLLVYSRVNSEFCFSLQQYPVGDSHNINSDMRAADGSGDTLGLQEKAPSRDMRYLVNITNKFHVATRSIPSPTRTHTL